MRGWLGVWLASLLIAAMGLGAIPLTAGPNPADDLVLPEAPVVVIGTSLLRHAIPTVGDGADGGVLGDGRPHLRLAASAISETQSLQLARRAIAGKADTIVMELSPFCRDFPNRVRSDLPADGRAMGWTQAVLKESNRLQRLFNRGVFGTNAGDWRVSRYMEDVNFNTFRTRDRINLADVYPLILRPPVEAEELRAVLALARQRGVDVYFISPPRSERAATYQGEADFAKQTAECRAVADQFGVAVIDIGPVWPNNFFFDHAHVNLAGRLRFEQDLRDWWAVHHGA